MFYVFIILAVLVLALSVYLGFLIVKLKNQKQLKEKLEVEYTQHFNQRRKELLDSLYTLALVMEQDQVSIAEGCIRIKKLIDLDEDLRFHEKLAPFHRAYIEFSDFAYLDAYKELSKQDKWEQDLKRQKIELKLAPTLKSASSELKLIVSKHLESYTS
jgi:hypothetical protein